MHEESGFSTSEREEILGESTQLAQWQTAIDLSFRKHHNVVRSALDESSLGILHSARRDALHQVLDNELRIIIEIRNKLAHGQWVYPLNSSGTSVESEKYRLINQENLESLVFKFQLLKHLADTTHDLVVSRPTFERDFEVHFGKLIQVRKNLQSKDYANYEAALVRRRQRGRQKARQSTSG